MPIYVPSLNKDFIIIIIMDRHLRNTSVDFN